MTGAADDGANPLERALELFAAHFEAGGDPRELLERHPDLRDLLEPMVLEQAAQVPSSEAAVLGDFRLVREIGRGGMGIVYEAWQRSLDRTVALKVLAPALVASPSAVARFRREAAAVARLRHPGIVEVHGFGSEGERHWFAMERIDGAPLHECIERYREPAAAVGFVCQVLEALAHAHQAGVVHRDVKPANVLVRADGAAVLTDFGLAQDAALPTLTAAGGFVGTLDYASPEQVQGQLVDARTDLWSVGVVLYELLAGERPFDRGSTAATMKAVLTEDPAPLRNQRPRVARDLLAILDRALAKEPERRYATAGAFLADLRAWTVGGVVSARAPGMVERLGRWIRREPWRATTAAVLLAATPLLALSLGYLWANAPRIAAAAAAETQARREELLANAWWQQGEFGPEAGLAALQAAPAELIDLDVRLLRAMLLTRLGRNDEATAVLASATGRTVEIVRRRIAGVANVDLALDPDDSAEDCYVRAAIGLDAALRRDGGNAAMLRATLVLARQAVVLSPVPRIHYLLIWANAAKHAGDETEVEAAVRGIEIHFPDSNAGLRTHIAVACERTPERCLELIARAEARGIDTLELRNNRGVALERLGKLTEAEAAYRSALALDDAYSMARTNLGNVLRLQKRFEESEMILNEAVGRRGASARAWNFLGLVRRARKDQDGARVAFRKAIEVRPDYAVPHYNLGNLELAVGDTEAAIAAYRSAGALDREYVQAFANLGNALRQAGQRQLALAEYLRAAWIAPKDLIPRFNIARTALDLGLAELGLEAARTAVELAPTRADVRWLLAEALLAQVPIDAAAALGAAREALAIERDPGLLERLVWARVLVASDQRTEAIEVLRAARAEPRFAKEAALTKVDALLGELLPQGPR